MTTDLSALQRALADGDTVGAIGECARLHALLLASLSVPPPVATPPPVDELVDVETAAAIAHRSVSWMRHHGHRLPGFTQPGGRGTRALWSRRALLAWAGAT